MSEEEKMKELKEIKEALGKNRRLLEEKYKVKELAVFGSYARGEQTEDSDLDLLVEFKEPVGFLFIHFADYLEELLGVKVDLITPEAIKPNRKKYILEDLVRV